jgi:hypothetical protein
MARKHIIQTSFIISFILDARINLSSLQRPIASATATFPIPSTLVYEEGTTVDNNGVSITLAIRTVDERR